MTNGVSEALAQLSNIEEKKMFRGITFTVKGKMCISVGDNEIGLAIEFNKKTKASKKKNTK